MATFTPDSFADGPSGNTPITAAKLNNIEQGVAAQDVRNPASEAAKLLPAQFPPFWAPATVYAQFQQVVSPNNDVVSALTGHTSGSFFTPANWKLSTSFATSGGLDASVASYVSTTGTSATKSALLARETVLSVRDYGAVGDGVTDDTVAIQAAIDDAIADPISGIGGGVVVLPQSTGNYRFTQLVIQNSNVSHLTIEGRGSSCLRSFDNLTTPAIIITGQGVTDNTGTGFVRAVTFRNLSIMGASYWNSNVQSDRLGVEIDQAQYVTFDNVWIGGYKRGAVKATDMWDCRFINCEFLYCGYATDDSNYAYAIELLGSFDQSNANKFIGCHMEDCVLSLHVGGGSRHNQWVAGKFESGANLPGTDGSSLSRFWFEDALEHVFDACMFAEDGNNGKFLFKASQTDSAYTTANNVNRSLAFTGCQFSANAAGAAKWFFGSYGRFTNCVFNRTNGMTSGGAFDFEKGSLVTGCTISMADSGIYVFHIAGANTTIRDNQIIGRTGATTGAVYTLDGAYDNVHISNNSLSGQFDTLATGAAISGDLGYGFYSTPKPVANVRSAGATIPVFLVDIVTLSFTAATTVTNLTQGHNGKRVILRATNGNATLQHGTNIFMKSGANVTMASGATVELANDVGVWREV